MQFRIADTFTASLARLPNEQQRAAKTTAFDLQTKIAHPSLSLHRVTGAKDPSFWSARVNLDLRIILHRAGENVVLCYVDSHDDAYRRAVGNWYLSKDIKQTVYQAVKYRQRYNWSHRDLLRKAHPKAGSSEVNDLFAWITQGTMPDEDNEYFSLIHAYEEAKTADVDRLVNLITRYDMTWEMMPSEQLDKPEVWEALAVRMPLTALVRNLATLTRLGVIAPMKSTWVCERLNAIGNPTVALSLPLGCTFPTPSPCPAQRR